MHICLKSIINSANLPVILFSNGKNIGLIIMMRATTNDLEMNGLYKKKQQPKAAHYIAIGMLLGIGLFLLLELIILLGGDKGLLSFVLVTGKNYAPGAIPNSSAGGGWNLGPLFFVFLLLGLFGGWGYYKIKTMLQVQRKRK